MNNEDKKTINLFISKVDELLSCKLLQEKHKVSYSLSFASEEGKATTILPDEELLRSFLLVFRNFYSPGEKINFFKMCSILENAITDTNVVSNIRKTQEIYQQALDKSPLSLVEGNKSLSPHEVMRRWMYGFYHHTNDKKREKIEAWDFAIGLTKMQFVSTIFSLAKCVLWLGNVAKDFSKGKIK